MQPRVKVTDTGAWDPKEDYVYYLDRGLLNRLGVLLAGSTVVEFGAGRGCYSDGLLAGGRHTKVTPYDGAPNVHNLTGGFIAHADLTHRLRLGRANWVLCLEVAEHIPMKHEDTLLDNLDRHNAEGIILSWSHISWPFGRGHINPRNKSYVESRFQLLGYVEDRNETEALSRAVSDFGWFKHSLHVFRRRPVGVLLR